MAKPTEPTELKPAPRLEEPPKLKRALGLFETTMYGVGIILGAGIYVLIGQAAGIAGNAVWMSFGIAAFVAAFSGLSYAELSSMFPKSAAEYIYTKKAFKSSRFSFTIGWLILFVLTLASAAVALGFGGYMTAIFGTPLIPAAIMLVMVLSFINFWGIKHAAWVNILFTIIEMIGLFIIIFLGVNYFGSVDYFELPAGFESLMSAAILVFFAYIGFEELVNISEEVKKPRKTMPKALIYSIIITTVIYILVALSSVSIVPWQELGLSEAPLADVANAAWPGSSVLLATIALFSTTNTVLFLLIACSRILYGMARENAMPKALSSVHMKRRTPWISVIVTMVLAIAFILIGDIKTVAEMTNWGTFAIFISINASLIYMRKTRPKARRPFKVPLSIGWLPVIPLLGLMFCVAMILQFELWITMFGIGVLASGAVAYNFLNRHEN